MIQLDNLVAIHDNPETIRRHRRVLEELFYLCINENFRETIETARVDIQNIRPQLDVELPCNKDTAIAFREAVHFAGPGYRTLLNSISEKHNYFHSSFVRNYFDIASDTNPRGRFNILENILFFNDPIPESNPIDHFKSRSGYMELGYDEVEGPCIRLQFDIGTTKKEMKDIIDKAFPEASELQLEKYKIPTKQYRPDSGLKIKQVIYEQTNLGQSDTQIAIQLETEGIYKEENTGDHVRLQRSRMMEEVGRFDSDD